MINHPKAGAPPPKPPTLTGMDAADGSPRKVRPEWVRSARHAPRVQVRTTPSLQNPFAPDSPGRKLAVMSHSQVDVSKARPPEPVLSSALLDSDREPHRRTPRRPQRSESAKTSRAALLKGGGEQAGAARGRCAPRGDHRPQRRRACAVASSAACHGRPSSRRRRTRCKCSSCSRPAASTRWSASAPPGGRVRGGRLRGRRRIRSKFGGTSLPPEADGTTACAYC